MSFSTKSFSLLQRDIFLFFTNVVTGIIIARVLGPTMMGLWVILSLIPSYAEALGRLKFDVAAVYFLGKRKSSIGEMVFILNFLALLTSIILVSLFIWQFDWFYTRLFHSSPVDMRLLTYFVLLIIPLQFIFMNYCYLHVYREDTKVYNKMHILNAMLSSTTGIAMLLILDWGILGILLGKILGLLVSLIYAGQKIKKVEKMRPNFNISLIKEMAKYSVHFYIGGIIGHLHIYITNLLVVLYLAPVQVAFFIMAKGRGEMFTSMVPSAIGMLLLPRISKSENINQSRELTARAFRVTFLILLFTGVILGVLIKPIVYVL
jgi:O-antigen/teichoic acid export membrane protein